jgi:hypothetical protein
MTVTRRDSQRYQIRVRGRLGETIRCAFPLGRQPPTCGVNPSSPDAATLSVSVAPCSDPATIDQYTDFGSTFFAALRHGHRLEPPAAHRDPPWPT